MSNPPGAPPSGSSTWAPHVGGNAGWGDPPTATGPLAAMFQGQNGATEGSYL